ncbi:hypothetical protein LCGC14_0477730 [marine sediment metagenome]|uniref:Resolvase/invertase-type recombinase catalytic domain-containing protein n=1 Tax=marine sediment metagenome TaxID=412755 RepID=A0A0F9STC3_9ZZZZ
MKVAIYARVSGTKKKEDGERRQDINRQLENMREFLKRKGVNQWKEYIDDGKSAFTEDFNQRPAFKQLLNDCKRFFIKEIYIEDMTRFSRNLSLGLQWLKELGNIDVQLISLKEGEFEVTSSKGWIQSTMMLMMAEWESRIRSEKVKSGMRKAKNLGKKIGGFRGGKKPKKKSKKKIGGVEVSL